MPDVNKDTLLRYFATLDLSTLQKLEKYSKLLIIPDEDMLVSATMLQMVDKAHALADVLFPEWTDRSKSDFGEFLIELFALFSEKDFWYINAFANEGTFRKIRSYSNAFSKASTLGYQPKTCTGAKANFSVVFAPGSSITYARGELVIDVDGVMFTNDDEFTVPTSAADYSMQLLLHEGEQLTEDVTFNGNCVFLRKENIDIDSVKVKIDNITYSRVRTFGLSDADSTHYLVLPEEDGSCSVYFGTNGMGVTPPLGRVIHLDYRICNGTDGNLSSGVARVNDSLDNRKATSVTMLGGASGGCYAESLTSIKERAPMYFSNKRAAVNEYSAEELLNSYDFVAKSKVFASGTEVFYQVIPMSGALEPTLEERQFIADNFAPFIMLGYTVAYTPNLYKNFIFTADHSATGLLLDVIASPGYPLSVVEEGVRQVISDITNPLVLANYGDSFNKVDADALMRARVAGVQSVSFKLLNGAYESVLPDFTLGDREIFRKIDQSLVTVRINVI